MMDAQEWIPNNWILNNSILKDLILKNSQIGPYRPCPYRPYIGARGIQQSSQLVFIDICLWGPAKGIHTFDGIN